MRSGRNSLVSSVALALLAAGCGSGSSPGLPQGAEEVSLDPSDFVATIDNPYWPMRQGSTWIYRETTGDGAVQRNVVIVTSRTKTILGIRATVVHDLVTEGGEPVEDTYDWYAQDADGNIWYLGEDTKEFENGKVTSTEGSWEAGVDGAQPGIALPADPQVGMRYRQEYLEGVAEDAGEILSLDERVRVPFGSFDGVLETEDTTPLEPDVVEHKYYAKDVGPVSSLTVAGGSDREVLLSYRKR
jgi:hypothetical protein